MRFRCYFEHCLGSHAGTKHHWATACVSVKRASDGSEKTIPVCQLAKHLVRDVGFARYKAIIAMHEKSRQTAMRTSHCNYHRPSTIVCNPNVRRRSKRAFAVQGQQSQLKLSECVRSVQPTASKTNRGYGLVEDDLAIQDTEKILAQGSPMAMVIMSDSDTEPSPSGSAARTFVRQAFPAPLIGIGSGENGTQTGGGAEGTLSHSVFSRDMQAKHVQRAIQPGQQGLNTARQLAAPVSSRFTRQVWQKRKQTAG